MVQKKKFRNHYFEVISFQSLQFSIYVLTHTQYFTCSPIMNFDFFCLTYFNVLRRMVKSQFAKSVSVMSVCIVDGEVRIWQSDLVLK